MCPWRRQVAHYQCKWHNITDRCGAAVRGGTGRPGGAGNLDGPVSPWGLTRDPERAPCRASDRPYVRGEAIEKSRSVRGRSSGRV